MEIMGIALLIVAALLLFWGRWIGPQRLNRQRQLNGYQPAKSNYERTFDVPVQNAARAEYSRTTAVPMYASGGNFARGHDAPARLVRDISTIIEAHSMTQQSASQTVEEFTGTKLWTAIARSGSPRPGSSAN